MIVLVASVLMACAPPPSEEETLELIEFCTRMAANQGERPESYVGSLEHVTDIERTLDAAPDDIRSQFVVFRDFIASGAIDTEADPDSNLFENWPGNVQDAVDAIQEYSLDNCSS